MRYFVLKQHQKASYPPVLRDVFTKIKKKNINISCHHLIEEPIFFDVSNRDCRYYDVIDRDLFLVSETLWNVFLIYLPDMHSKIVALIDHHNLRIENYYIPIFEEFNCLSEKSIFNRSKTVLKEMVLDYRLLSSADIPIFCIKIDVNPIVIVRLDVAESILRRNPIGIQLEEVMFD